MKECSKCGIVKELDDFSRNKKGKQGRSAECKACEKERHKAYLSKKRLRSKKRWEEASVNGDLTYWSIRADRMNSRAKQKFNSIDRVTGEELENLFKENPDCYYCQSPLISHSECHIDHITPLSRGGRNMIENMVTSCSICNSVIKSDMTPDEMYDYIERIYLRLSELRNK